MRGGTRASLPLPKQIIHAVVGMNGSDASEKNQDARRSVVLVTGMSGCGKSTVLAQLKLRGHRVIDTDDPGWIMQGHAAGGVEPIWDLARIKALIDGHLSGCLFIAGCVANQGEVYDRFDAVVLLSAPIDVILDRVADRANPFGSLPEEQAKIASDLAMFEPHLRAGADCEIVTTAPVLDVVAELEQIARCGERRDPLPRRRAHHA
jgi:broad-specificity NMP kinase